MTSLQAAAFLVRITDLVVKATVIIFAYELGVYRDDIVAFLWKARKKVLDD